MDLIIASNNQGKIREIKAILAPYFDKVLSLKDAGVEIDVEETGATFYENALLKAAAIYDVVKTAVISDDSGICVKALGGAPGVFSARYAGQHGDDTANNMKLLDELKKAGAVTNEQRAAYFESAVVLYISPEKVICGEGRTHGYILDKFTGSGGFGYDCIFFSNDLKMSFGLAGADDKNRVSHRARAITETVNKFLMSGGI